MLKPDILTKRMFYEFATSRISERGGGRRLSDDAADTRPVPMPIVRLGQEPDVRGAVAIGYRERWQ